MGVYSWGYIRIMEKKMETTILYLCICWGYSPPSVDRIWGIWGSYYTIPKAIFDLLKWDYKYLGRGVLGSGGLLRGYWGVGLWA